MQLSAMRTALRGRLGIPSGDGQFPDARLNDLINSALQQIALDGPWRWLAVTETFNTAADDAIYDLATELTYPVFALEAVTVNGCEAVEVPYVDILVWDTVAGDRRENVFGYEQDNLYLRPIPGDVWPVVVKYQRAETELSGDTDEPVLPAYLQRGLIDLAASLGYDEVADRQMAAHMGLRYEGWKRRAQMSVTGGRQPRRARVRPGGGIW